MAASCCSSALEEKHGYASVGRVRAQEHTRLLGSVLDFLTFPGSQPLRLA